MLHLEKNALAITTCFAKFTLVALAIKFYFISVTKCKAIMNFFSSQVHSLHFVMLRFLSYCFIYNIQTIFTYAQSSNVVQHTGEQGFVVLFAVVFVLMYIFSVSVAFLAFTFICHSLNSFRYYCIHILTTLIHSIHL